MATYDPTELIELCRRITEDGDLTGDEIYLLTEWLNAHPEACDEWPGSLLVAPLQQVWADGKVNRTELRRIGKLLFEIEAEWAERYVRAPASEAAESFDIFSAVLPSIDVQIQVPSESVDETYVVSLAQHSCNCPDWLAWRSDFPPGNLGRCCKHVVRAFLSVQPADAWPGWIGAFLQERSERGRGTHPREDWFVIQTPLSPILASLSETEWCNVFALNRTKYTRFGYNFHEDRWSYGIAPPNDATIRQAIRRRVGH